MIIKGLIFVILLYISYSITREMDKRINKKIIEAQNIRKIRKLDLKKYESLLYKNEKYKTKLDKLEERLRKQGNPLNLSPSAYYMIKIITTLSVIALTIYCNANLLLSIAASIVTYFTLDILYYLSNADDTKKMLRDLPDICDILDIQTSAGVDLGLALTEVYDVPKIKRLNKRLMELAAEINLTKNPIKAVDNFIESFEQLEIRSFGMTIKQALETGKSKELLTNQSEVLKENNIFAIQNETKKVDMQLIIVTILIFLGIFAVIFYSFSIQIQGNLLQIFY